MALNESLDSLVFWAIDHRDCELDSFDSTPDA